MNNSEKSYSGNMMTAGTSNEQIVMEWLKTRGSKIIDFREFRLAQRIDVDFGIETIDGNIVLAEIKSDKWIKENGNLLFECNRINHYVKNKWFYLGWGWRSPAQNLIVRNPETGETFIFDFLELRVFIGKYIHESGKNFKQNLCVVETDRQKTTFNYLIAMTKLSGLFKKHLVI